MVWDVSESEWSFGNETVKAGTFEGAVTGAVTGTVSSIANHDTDDVSEGSSNLYFTNARADARIANAILDSDSMTGALATNVPSAESVKAYVDSVAAGQDNTDEITEGSTNLFFTNARARGAVSVTDAGGDGSFAYNSTTGVFTYTGPSAAEVRAHFGGGTGISISSGTISTDDSGIDHDALNNFVANEHIDHSAVSMTAGAGLTGGGTIAATRDFAVGAGTGITVNANDVAVNMGAFSTSDLA